MHRIYYIYALRCPITKEVRYIGKTHDLGNRLRNHVYDSKNSRYKKAQWIKGLLSKNTRPEIYVLEECSIDEVVELEMFYISYLRGMGVRLLNMTDGGDGVTMTDEIRAKISNAVRGKLAGVRHPNYGKKLRQDTCDKIRDAHVKSGHMPPSRLGSNMSDKAKRNCREAALPRSIPVFIRNCETGEEKAFKSLHEASRHLNMDRHNLSNCLKNGWKILKVWEKNTNV